MPLLKEENYTIEDIYALPEGERAELIDGKIYYMAPPSRKHQDVRFMRLLLRYIWMKQRIHMLSRTYLLSVILIS